MSDVAGEDQEESVPLHRAASQEYNLLLNTLRFCNTMAIISVVFWTISIPQIFIIIMLPGDNTAYMMISLGLSAIGSLCFLISHKTRHGLRHMYPEAWSWHSGGLKSLSLMLKARKQEAKKSRKLSKSK